MRAWKNNKKDAVDVRNRRVTFTSRLAKLFSRLKLAFLMKVARWLSVPVYRSGLDLSPLDYAGELEIFTFASLATCLCAVVVSVVWGAIPLDLYPAILAAIASPLVYLVVLFLGAYVTLSNRMRGCEREFPFLAHYLMMSSSLGISARSAFQSLINFSRLQQFKKESLRMEKIRCLSSLNALEALKFEGKFYFEERAKALLSDATEKGSRSTAEQVAYIFSQLEAKLSQIPTKFSVILSAEMVAFFLLPLGAIALGALSGAYIGLAFLCTVCFALPAISFIALGWAIDSGTPKELTEPLPAGAVYRSMAALPLAALILLSGFYLSIPIYYVSGLAMISLLGPPAYFFLPCRRRARDALTAMPAFTRSVAEEFRKGGPLKLAIARVYEKGSFNGHFETFMGRVVAFLKIGSPVSKAISTVDAPWIAKISLELMDSAEIMGAGPESLESLSDLLAKLNFSFRSLVSQASIFSFMSYMASLTLLIGVAGVIQAAHLPAQGADTLASLGYLGQASASSGQIFESVAYLGVIFNAFLLGLLSGKASGGGSFADGLKPAMICVSIALAGTFLFQGLGLDRLLG
jgi:hypothetical protein